jgi:hypothetical protein
MRPATAGFVSSVSSLWGARVSDFDYIPSSEFDEARRERIAALEVGIAELRAVLSPRLDHPLVRGPVGMICAWCSARALPTEDDYREEHRPGCPVIRRDALLGRPE